jgi:SAM-dependent methyltransferase/uncharacterized protein YbaR (Trm112 family)
MERRMNSRLLELLRCPYCGSRLHAQASAHSTWQDPAHGTAILGCQCCAYPVVAGIPYLATGRTAEEAMRCIGEGHHDRALFALLGLPEEKQEQFRTRLHDKRPATFRTWVQLLCPGPEGEYLFHRFSDPSYLCSRAVLRAVGQDSLCFVGHVLDVCGGTGHLTRTLCDLAGTEQIILADLSFAKLWLARQFVVPGGQAVCCNANEPLPFAPGRFSLVVCSDAFHYVWSRRLLACEMIRLLDEQGTIILPHLHNLLADNCSAGMPLAPADYRNLFQGLHTRLFKESRVLDSLLEGQDMDFSADPADEELHEEPALVLMATRRGDLFRAYEHPRAAPGGRPLARNPLYSAIPTANGERWELEFPSAGYEFEFASCKRYLPTTISVTSAELDSLRTGELDGRLKRLAEQQVLLDLPERYL